MNKIHTKNIGKSIRQKKEYKIICDKHQIDLAKWIEIKLNSIYIISVMNFTDVIFVKEARCN